MPLTFMVGSMTKATTLFFIIGNFIRPALLQERIIGGTVVEGSERPSFMAIFNFVPGSAVKCSCSIISNQFVVSAAHCLSSKKHYTDGNCLDDTGKKKLKFSTECKTMPNGDRMLIFPQQKEKSPEVWIGVDDLSEDASDESKRFRVEYIITKEDGYKGGAYGDYGGIDIILIKLEKNIPAGIKKACLAGPQYKFSNPKIGGYGRYRRVPCEVNDLGPHVYRYCKVDPTCKTGSREFSSAQCQVHFTYGGKGRSGCVKDMPTPSSTNVECIKMKEAKGITDRSMNREDVNEIVILDDANKVITKCYRNAAGQHGWCGVTDLTVDGKFENNEEDFIVEADRGWGFCSDTCEDSERVSLTGKARIKDVMIIDQTYCDEKLHRTRTGKPPFKVPPKVYCVAYNETYKTKFFQKTGGSYKELPSSAELQKQILGREHPWFIRATGSCKGDSGGPLYEQNGDQYVLLGSTSRGTGSLANCGGIDNPTHYVRMNDMIDWFKVYIPEGELCIK